MKGGGAGDGPRGDAGVPPVGPQCVHPGHSRPPGAYPGQPALEARRDPRKTPRAGSHHAANTHFSPLFFPCGDPKNFRLSLLYCTGLLSTFPFHASSPFSTPQTVEMQAAKETHHDAVTGDQEHPAAGVFPLLAPQAVHRCSSPWGPAGRHWRRTAWKAVCEKPRCSESLPLLPGSARELNRAPRPIAILQTTKAGHTRTQQGRRQGRENKGETLGKVGTLKTKTFSLVENHCSFCNLKLQPLWRGFSLSWVGFGDLVFRFEANLLLSKVILWSQKYYFF